jgi:hypothetical protein
MSRNNGTHQGQGHGPGPTPQLNPHSLFDSQASLDRIRVQVFNRILATIHDRIKFIAAKQNSPQMMYYNVPEWQPGCPRFDVKDCILYLVWNLRQSGFKVLYVPANRLLISWKEQAIQYYTQDSPIRQAMLNVSQTGQNHTKDPEKSILKKTATYRPVNEGVVGLLTNGPKRDGTITFI